MPRSHPPTTPARKGGGADAEGNFDCRFFNLNPGKCVRSLERCDCITDLHILESRNRNDVTHCCCFEFCSLRAYITIKCTDSLCKRALLLDRLSVVYGK